MSRGGRLLAAAAHLVPAANRPGGVPEEGEGEEDNQVSVKRYCPPNLSNYTQLEMEDLLVSKVLYNDHDLVALWKPYGLHMFPSAERGVRDLETFLPNLAPNLGCHELYEVHRLDHTTTGVVLYAKSPARRDHLKQLFAQRKVEKTYLAITNGVPRAGEGIVDIPVGSGKFGDRYRMTLRPNYSDSKVVTNKKTSHGERQEAVTEYRVVAQHSSAALVECVMRTGRKHQIRLHLGLGLGTPVLGDHKFSYPDQLDRPQRVKGDMVDRLRIRGSRARDLPIFLHARRVAIPGILPAGDLVITANLPHFFTKTMKRLRLNPTEKS